MAAVVSTLYPDMGESMIKALVDDSFDSLFANSTATGHGRLSGHGQSSFIAKFNANMVLLETAEAGLSAQARLTGGTSWANMVATINTVLGNAKTAVNA